MLGCGAGAISHRLRCPRCVRALSSPGAVLPLASARRLACAFSAVDTAHDSDAIGPQAQGDTRDEAAEGAPAASARPGPRVRA